MPHKLALLPIAAATLLSVLCGCNAPPIGPELCRRPESDTPTLYKGGGTSDGVYASADCTLVDGGEQLELLYFPGGAFYRLEHGLGEIPRWWQFHLSFERRLAFEGAGGGGGAGQGGAGQGGGGAGGAGQGGGDVLSCSTLSVGGLFEEGSLAPAAGNQVELKGIDETHLTLVNASCVEYYLLVIAGTGDGP